MKEIQLLPFFIIDQKKKPSHRFSIFLRSVLYLSFLLAHLLKNLLILSRLSSAGRQISSSSFCSFSCLSTSPSSPRPPSVHQTHNSCGKTKKKRNKTLLKLINKKPKPTITERRTGERGEGEGEKTDWGKNHRYISRMLYNFPSLKRNVTDSPLCPF